MRKKLLLVTAFLAVAGTAMAVTSEEIGRGYYEKSDVKIEAAEKMLEKKIDEATKRYETAVKQVDDKYTQMEKVGEADPAKFLELLREISEGSEELEREELTSKLDELKTEKAKLDGAIDKELAKEANSEEVKTKLRKDKKVLDLTYNLADEGVKLNNEYGEKIDKLVENSERADFEILTRSVAKINSSTYVSEMLGVIDNGRSLLYTDNGVETAKQYFEGFAEVKNVTTAAEKAYTDAVAAENKLKANANAKEAEKKAAEELVKAKKAEFDAAKKVEMDSRKTLNEILSIAGTDIDTYLSKKDADKVKEVARVTEALDNWTAERDHFYDVADYYAYGIYRNDKDELFEGTEDTLGSDEIRFRNAALRITENAINIENNKKAIAKNAQDIRDLRKDHNKGMAQMAAMASVDFGNVKARTVKVGAGIGQHASETAVAVGVAVTPTDALMINAKWSTSTNSIKKSTLGLGATYEFNF